MPSPVESVSEKLLSTAATFIKEKRLPGACLGVVHEGGLAWSGAVGHSDQAARRVGTTRTLHRIASITKTVAATTVMQLRDAGRLDLDDPLATYLPEFAAAAGGGRAAERITLRRMLSHESGLMSEPPGADYLHGIEPALGELLGRAGVLEASVPVNTQFKYSNLAYTLLGEVVARVSGTTFQEYARTHVLEPLGMTRTVFDPGPGSLPAGLTDDVATPYRARWMSDVLEPAPPSPMASAEGGLWSCVDDLARWLAFALETTDDGGHPDVLSLATRAEMHVPRYLANEAWTRAFGIGWAGERRDDVVWTGHSGSLFGFMSAVLFDRKTGVGVVVLLNGEGAAYELALTLGAIAREPVLSVAPAIEVPPPPPESALDLLGLYAEDEIGGQITRVEWRDGALTIVFMGDDDFRPVLDPTDQPDVWLVRPGMRWSGERICFLRRPDGRVRAMAVPGEVIARFDRVEPPSAS